MRSELTAAGMSLVSSDALPISTDTELTFPSLVYRRRRFMPLPVSIFIYSERI